MYLPTNHALAAREINYYYKKYLVGNEEKELPLCVTMMSHNNIQNLRYKRAIESVLQQNYSNYQLVFIDDVSDDDTLLATKKILTERGFPAGRVKLVRNL